jgi:ABC-2 type transport system permease protein
MPEVTADPGDRLPGFVSLLGEQIGYQLRLLLRTPRTVFAGLLFPVVLVILRSSKSSGHGNAAEGAIVAGLLVLSVVTTAYLSHATGLVTSREAGVLRRWRATPLPAWCLFAGRIVAVGVLAVIGSAATVIVAIALFGLKLDAGMVPGLLVAVVAGALAWAAAGTAITPVVPSADAGSLLLSVTYLPVVLFSGVLGPLTGSPTWLIRLVSYLPAEPMVDIATRSLQHAGGVAAIPPHDLAVLAAWAIVGVLAAVRFFRWEPSRTARAAGR